MSIKKKIVSKRVMKSKTKATHTKNGTAVTKKRVVKKTKTKTRSKNSENKKQRTNATKGTNSIQTVVPVGGKEGIAEEQTQDTMSRSMMALVRMAIKNQYDIPEKELTEVPKQLMRVLMKKKASDRHVIMAAKTLAEVRKFNFDQMVQTIKLSDGGLDDDGVKQIKSPIKMPTARKQSTKT